MTTFFVDASALGRRYLSEIGTAWVLSWITESSGNVIIVSDIAAVEMFTTIARLQRSGAISATNAQLLQASVMTDMAREYLSVPIDSDTLAMARTLTNRHLLRTLDAIQLACATIASTTLGETLIFISGDNRLLLAAAAEGFATDNPYLHP